MHLSQRACSSTEKRINIANHASLSFLDVNISLLRVARSNASRATTSPFLSAQRWRFG